MVLGEGESRTSLQSEIERLGLADRVCLIGYVSNPLPYMAAATVFVMSSRFEGLGNALIEAMACGTAVVSTDCPSGPAEILEGGRWGRLVPVGDSHALAKALEAALEDRSPPDVRRRAAEFTVERSASEYLRLLIGDAGPATGADS
jgi:glycosyltransferase involved in cell wall biosynthesis